ncbi:MAG: hypothetical protein ACJZ40_01480 [Candidatus Poseidoniaceae archaeon]|tara:strand:+ start:569 stop:808 length:240 start_codon:yes stop_codon:yes gene_type:complete
MTNIRGPKDEDEFRKARLAVAMGMGRTLEDVVGELLGYAPDEAFIDAVRNRIKYAQECEEEFDFSELIEHMAKLQNDKA